MSNTNEMDEPPSTERLRAPIWYRLSPEQQAASDRALEQVRSAEDLDPEHIRRLATLLGLRGTDTNDEGTER